MLKEYNASSIMFPKTRAYFGVESFIDNFIGREKPVNRDTSSSKWDVVDGKLKTLPLQFFLIIAMSINGETSVIINATTTIKLIKFNKKNNYKSIFNVFATAIYRYSRMLLRTDDDHFPVKCQLNQFQYIVSYLQSVNANVNYVKASNSVV